MNEMQMEVTINICLNKKIKLQKDGSPVQKDLKEAAKLHTVLRFIVS